MNLTPESVLQLANQIVEAKDVLNELNKKWEKIFPGTGGLAPENPVPASASVPLMSLAARIIAAVTAQPNRNWAVGELCSAVGDDDAEKVKRSLNKLVFKEKIERRGRSLYGYKRL